MGGGGGWTATRRGISLMYAVGKKVTGIVEAEWIELRANTLSMRYRNSMKSAGWPQGVRSVPSQRVCVGAPSYTLPAPSTTHT